MLQLPEPPKGSATLHVQAESAIGSPLRFYFFFHIKYKKLLFKKENRNIACESGVHKKIHS